MKDDAVYQNNYYEQYEPQWGLTKREHFAAMAMQGFLSDGVYNDDPAFLAKEAVSHADALLEELEK